MERGEIAGEREDVETKKGKSIVVEAAAIIPTTLPSLPPSAASVPLLSNGHVYPVSTPHPWEQGGIRERAAGERATPSLFLL